MRTAIVVPEYFPGPAVAAVMVAAERIVLADTYQYVRQSRQNRARVRTPDGGQWLSVPLVGGQHGLPVRAIRTDPRSLWRTKHRKALQFNYGASPYFEHYISDLEAIWRAPVDCLAPISIATTEWCVRKLGITAVIVRASDLDGEPDHARTILNAIGGGTLVIPEAAWSVDDSHGGDTVRLRYTDRPYRQQFDGFEAGCSMLDMLMLHGPASRQLIADRVTTVR